LCKKCREISYCCLNKNLLSATFRLSTGPQSYDTPDGDSITPDRRGDIVVYEITLGGPFKPYQSLDFDDELK